MGESRRCKRKIMQRKMFRCNDVRLYFRFFVPFFPPKLRQSGSCELHLFFFLSHVGAVCAVQQFALAIMFLGQRDFFLAV